MGGRWDSEGDISAFPLAHEFRIPLLSTWPAAYKPGVDRYLVESGLTKSVAAFRKTIKPLLVTAETAFPVSTTAQAAWRSGNRRRTLLRKQILE